MDQARRVVFGKGLMALALTLGCDLDLPQVALYWRVLKDVPSDVLDEAFGLAAETKWKRMPQAGELKALAAGVMQARRKAAADRHLRDCPHGHARMVENAHGRMEKCGCWKRAVAAMQQVGHPIALPAMAEEA